MLCLREDTQGQKRLATPQQQPGGTVGTVLSRHEGVGASPGTPGGRFFAKENSPGGNLIFELSEYLLFTQRRLSSIKSLLYLN